jgi:hypothetical protein
MKIGSVIADAHERIEQAPRCEIHFLPRSRWRWASFLAAILELDLVESVVEVKLQLAEEVS